MPVMLLLYHCLRSRRPAAGGSRPRSVCQIDIDETRCQSLRPKCGGAAVARAARPSRLDRAGAEVVPDRAEVIGRPINRTTPPDLAALRPAAADSAPDTVTHFVSVNYTHVTARIRPAVVCVAWAERGIGRRDVLLRLLLRAMIATPTSVAPWAWCQEAGRTPAGIVICRQTGGPPQCLKLALGRALQVSDMRCCQRLAEPRRDGQPETERARVDSSAG
jgi:hypothetical protein